MSEIRSQATPARDSGLTDALRDAVGDNYDHGRNPNLTGQLWHEDGIRDSIDWAGAARDLEREGWSRPRTVNSATELDALNPNAVCSFVDSNGITYACTAAEWQMGGFFSATEPFPTITVHSPGTS